MQLIFFLFTNIAEIPKSRNFVFATAVAVVLASVEEK